MTDIIVSPAWNYLHKKRTACRVKP